MKLDSDSFSKVLIAERKKRPLTQEQIADVAEIERSFVSLLETGSRQPSLATVFQIALALGIRPSRLVELVEREAREA